MKMCRHYWDQGSANLPLSGLHPIHLESSSSQPCGSLPRKPCLHSSLCGLGIPCTVLQHSPRTSALSLWKPSVTTPRVNSSVGWRTVVFDTSRNNFYMVWYSLFFCIHLNFPEDSKTIIWILKYIKIRSFLPSIKEQIFFFSRSKRRGSLSSSSSLLCGWNLRLLVWQREEWASWTHRAVTLEEHILSRWWRLSTRAERSQETLLKNKEPST